MLREDENKIDAMRYFWALFLAGLARAGGSGYQFDPFGERAARRAVAEMDAKNKAEVAAHVAKWDAERAEREKKEKAKQEKRDGEREILAIQLSFKKLGPEVFPGHVANCHEDYSKVTWQVVLHNGDVLQFSYFPDSGLVYYHKREDQ
mgnify:FL=1